MEPCDPNIFKSGHSIVTLDACAHRAETFVCAIRGASEQPVDWHYSGGVANVLYLGDHAKVAAAIDRLAWMLDQPMAREETECGSCSGNSHRPGVILRRFAAEAHGPYRDGDPLPAGTIAVDTIHDVAIIGAPK